MFPKIPEQKKALYWLICTDFLVILYLGVLHELSCLKLWKQFYCLRSRCLHRYMCKKDFHMLVYHLWGSSCLFVDLCQITGVPSSPNFPVSTFAAKCFHISPLGLLWHEPHSHILRLRFCAAVRLSCHFEWEPKSKFHFNQCLYLVQ